MGLGEWRDHCEYKRSEVHHDDRCRAEIDGETKPPRCRDSAQYEGERAHRQVTQEIEGGEYAAAVVFGRRRADHLQSTDKQEAVRPSRGGGRQEPHAGG